MSPSSKDDQLLKPRFGDQNNQTIMKEVETQIEQVEIESERKSENLEFIPPQLSNPLYKEGDKFGRAFNKQSPKSGENIFSKFISRMKTE